MPVLSLHKLASPLLYAGGSYLRGWRRQAAERPFTLVLVYHRVVADQAAVKGHYGIEKGIAADVFEAQLRFMLKHFMPIRACQALEEPSAALRFAVTLDDGYADNFTVAAPILDRLGIPATFFVVSDYVGTDRLFWWEQLAAIMRASDVPSLDAQAVLPELVGAERLPQTLPLHTEALREQAYERLSRAIRTGPHEDVPRHMQRLSDALGVVPREEGREYGLMDWAQLQALSRQGHDIGGHTASHSNVIGLSPDLIRREILSSCAAIEERLDAPVRSFAYPYGVFDRQQNAAADALASVGCRVAFTGDKGAVHAGTQAYELPRAVLNRRYPFACAYNVQDALDRAPH